MQKIQLTTDGSCIGNPGPGGWACILRSEKAERELIGRELHTTNNRMELTAAIRGLAALKQPSEVEVITDSEYVLRGATERLPHWKSNGWTLCRCRHSFHYAELGTMPNTCSRYRKGQ
jgi:ribonuclease HI